MIPGGDELLMARRTRQSTSVDREAVLEALGEAVTAPLAERPAATADPERLPTNSGRVKRAASSLIRWEHQEVLRDAVTDYARREHHSVHAVLVESIRRGLALIDSEGWAPGPSRSSRNNPRARSKREERDRQIVIELKAHAYQEDDESWTIEIPRLKSKTPSGESTVATGSASTSRGIAQAALELASGWLDVDPTEVAVHVTVDDP